VADVLVVCHANQCRSPLGEALLRAHLERAGVHAIVSSAGFLEGGRPAASGSVRAAKRRGLDLRDHRSRQVTPDLVLEAGLVLVMETRQVREIAVLAPGALERTFTVKDLVARGTRLGRRRPDESVEEWIARLHADRQHADLLRDDPADDVADPMGGTAADYERTADELDVLLGRLVGLVD
jgi:protein-tyrosine-phosphatase